ncbi:hypothetical protein B0F90DRAFT_1336342 [Multifurca ochricompacta]|uniref:Transcription factor TFIIIC triple barrel domain-containing protein n=1 Tax=Multifurca ochricompacta TaxID=376703 RepID=A0AAD4LX74_9AGAM|nr:hypothetical protein B0F90DRAFT_1336342 [Multifurca ochricompacta]
MKRERVEQRPSAQVAWLSGALGGWWFCYYLVGPSLITVVANMNFDKRLASGYCQVDAFDSDDHYECDENGEVIEEISYVTLDLGTVEPTLVPSSSTYRLIGLDTPTPFLQLSGTIFQGTHQSLLGTELLFTEDKDPQDQTRRKIAHLANTSQRIHFKSVEVRPKGAPPEPSARPTSRSKGKGVSGKQKTDAVDDVNVVDLITGNIEPGDVQSQSRKGGKGRRARGSGSQTSHPQSGNTEQTALSGETSSVTESAMDP